MDWPTALLTIGTWIASAITTLAAISFQDHRREKAERRKYLEGLIADFTGAAGTLTIHQYALSEKSSHYSYSEAIAVASRLLHLNGAINVGVPDLKDEAQRLYDAAVNLYEREDENDDKDDPAVVQRDARFRELRDAQQAFIDKAKKVIESETNKGRLRR